MPALTPADDQTRPSLTKIAFGSTRMLGKPSCQPRTIAPMRRGALSVQHAGPGQRESPETDRGHPARLGQHLRNPFHQLGVLAHLPDARPARDHQRIDLMRPDAVDRGGIDHHPDVGRHQPARGREIGQRIARTGQFDRLPIPRTPAPDRRYPAGSRPEKRRSRCAASRAFRAAPDRRGLADFEGILSFKPFEARLYSSRWIAGVSAMSRNLGRQYRDDQIALDRLRGLQFSGCIARQPRRPAAADGCDERHHRRQLEGDRTALDGGLLPVRQQIQPHSGL